MIDYASKQYITDHATQHERLEAKRKSLIELLRAAGKYLPESTRKWTSDPTVLRSKK